MHELIHIGRSHRLWLTERGKDFPVVASPFTALIDMRRNIFNKIASCLNRHMSQ